MKTQIKTNNWKTLATAVALVLFTSTSFSQGLLVESASNFFKSLLSSTINTNASETEAYFVKLDDVKNETIQFAEFTDRVFSRFQSTENSNAPEQRIISSYRVDAVELSFESELRTEEWMSESLSENLEVLSVESWMVEPLSNELENEISAEAWMSESFTENFESAIVTEEWMTESFTESFESNIETEQWMTESLTESFESNIETEEWMTTPIYTSLEEEVSTEDWMTVLLF